MADIRVRMDADLFAPLPAPRRAAWLSAARQWRPLQWLGTLKARLAAGGLAMLLASMSVTAWQLGGQAERGLLQQAQRREQADVRRTAAAIGARLREMERALQAVGAQIEPLALADVGRLGTLLDAQPLLRDRFANVFVADADGRVAVQVDAAGLRFPEVTPPEQAMLRAAMEATDPLVVEPMQGALSNEPGVVLTVALRRGGRVHGVIGGSLPLASRDLLRDLAGSVDDDDAALIVVTDRDGRILSHPKRALLLTSLQDEPRLVQPFLQWAARGRPTLGPGSAWAVDSHVVAAASDGVAGWQVWRAVPQQAVLGPLREARAEALRSAALLALALSGVLLVFLAWQLRPLARLERRAAALLSGNDDGEWPRAGGEIGKLSRTLRHVWAERSQVESFNAQVLQKLGSVMAAAPVGLAFTRSQRFELVSAEFCQLVGRREPELVGQPSQLVFLSNEDAAALESRLAEAFGSGQPYAGEWELLRADGTRFWALLRARPVDAANPAAGAIWSINDISEQIQARRALEHAANHDALTGVVNRQGFERTLQDLFDGQPATRPASLLMIDLDHFKPINDTAGHAAGDAMLVAVAQAITSRVRSSDVVVRLGGDEFAVVLPRCDHERAMAVAEKVRTAISDLALTWQAHTLRVGASLGVAELAAHHESPAQWLAQADAACYEAKRAGRGTVRSARPALRVLSGGG